MKYKETNPFYSAKAWKRKREVILRRDGYIDQLEKRAGYTIEADTVHHIFPIDKYPEYKDKAWNLISVSRQTHEELHDRMTGELSEAGKKLLQETAERQGIKASELVLVCGMPGSGKTAWVKRNLGEGLTFDLDYIAAAFRLELKTTEHQGARKMANTMAEAFAINARKYARRVFIIRTAPTIEEFTRLDPDKVILCEGGAGGNKKINEKRKKELEARYLDLKEYLKANGFNFEVRTLPAT